MQQLNVLLGDVARCHGLLNYVLVVSQGDKLHAGVLKRLLRHGEAVGERSHHAHNLEACRAQGLDGLQAAAAGRDEVLYHHHLRAQGQLALYEVAHAVVLSLAAHVGEGQAQLVGNERALGDGASGNAGHGHGLGEILEHGVRQLKLDEAAQAGVRQGLAVVAIERRLPSRSPREGVLGLQLDSLYVQQF